MSIVLNGCEHFDASLHATYSGPSCSLMQDYISSMSMVTGTNVHHAHPQEKRPSSEQSNHSSSGPNFSNTLSQQQFECNEPGKSVVLQNYSTLITETSSHNSDTSPVRSLKYHHSTNALNQTPSESEKSQLR